MSQVLFGLFLLFACRPPQGTATDSWDKAFAVSEKLQAEGNFAEARKTLLAVMPDASSASRLGRAYNDLGAIAQQEGRFTEAERYYRLAITQWESIPGHLGIARTMNNLASLLYLTDRISAADQFLTRAEKLQIEAMGTNHPETARLFQNRATIYLSVRQYKKAEPAFQQALEIWERFAPKYDVEIASVTRGLAIICRRTGRSQEADLYNARARMIWERQLDNGYAAPEVRAALAAVYLEAHEPLLAEPVLKQALKTSETQLGPGYPFLASILKMYAEVCRLTGRKAEAKQMEQRVKQIESVCSQACLAQQTVAASDLLTEKQSRLH